MIDGLRIPLHWRWATFADVAEVASDLVDPTLTPDAIHIAPNHIESWTGKLLPYATVAADGVTSPKHRFHAGQILYSKIRPYLAKAAFATFEGVCSADMYPVESSVDTKFLLHWLLSPWFTGQTARNQGRTILPKINQDALGRMPVPVAPLSEQQRIAAKIEELFSDLDAGVAALERIRENLKRYRAAVLKAAVEGRLTEEWRAKHPKTEPASNLLERILAERRQKWEEDQLANFAAADKTPPKGWREKYVEPAAPDTSGLPELPQGWCWATVEQVNSAERPISYGVLQPGDDLDRGIPLVRVCDVADGRVAIDQLKRIAPSISEQYRRTILQGGEVLLTVVGTIGRTAVAPVELAGANTARAVAVIAVVAPHNPNFLELTLRESSMRAKLTLAAHEVARKTLNLEDVRVAVVPIAPLEEQTEILKMVAEKVSQIEAAETSVEQNMKRAVRLRQSILKRAFEGKLVPQDPTDEPADRLLERIRQERAVTNGSVAPRSRRGRVSSQQAEDHTDGAAS